MGDEDSIPNPSEAGDEGALDSTKKKKWYDEEEEIEIERGRKMENRSYRS